MVESPGSRTSQGIRLFGDSRCIPSYNAFRHCYYMRARTRFASGSPFLVPGLRCPRVHSFLSAPGSVSGIFIIRFRKHTRALFSAANPNQSEIADGQRPIVIRKILIIKQIRNQGRLLRLENVHVHSTVHVFFASFP